MTEPISFPSPAPAEAPPTHPARWPDAVLAALVLIFAFLSASFVARNSDLWLHLAAGRLLARGAYRFGADPFAYTTGGTYWANQAWLSDLALYAGYRAVGGAGLVALKAAAVAVLAALLLRLARGGGGPAWVGGACVLLAVLAMSPRLLLQPAGLSPLLLAACLCLLRAGGRALYALPAVVALWVNLDAWFLLGPLAVALFGLGQFLAPPAAGARRLPRWSPPACLAACLLSPHHVHALTLPAEISPAVRGSAFAHDVRFAALFASPWGLAPLGASGGFSLAAWAYLVLLSLGLVSFAVNRPAWRDWRCPVWLAFALLGAWQARLVPFFAVVAGPITALNLRERLPPHALVRLGRVGLLLASLALLALTWPGWLQGFGRRDRPLGWAVHTDPSLARVAGTLALWRRQGTLPPTARTFAVHPDVAHYCAWFCPGEKAFLDSRLPLFLPVAADYEQLCQALDPTLRGDPAADDPSPSGWQRTLRDNHIACLVLYDPDRRRLAPGLRQVVLSPRDWELLRVDGQAVIVGRKEALAGPLASMRFDPGCAVFAAPPDETLPPAPAEGPPQLARPLPWWHQYLERPGGSTWEADAAAIYLRLFEDGAAGQLRRQRVPVLARHAAGLAGLPALSMGGVPSSVTLASRLALGGTFLPDLRERPPELPLLGVRAARRAVAAHPDDAGAWLVLAQAYLSLGRTTAEATEDALPPLAQVRHVQTVTALVQAVTLKPDLAAAHETLALLYAERHYLDLALQHRSAQLRLTRQAGRLPGEDQASFAARLERLGQAVGQMQAVVQDGENRFAVRAQPLSADPLVRARLALQLGLAGKALDEVLLPSHPDLYGVEGLRLLLELLLLTGRAQDARDLLDRDELRRNPDGLGFYDLPGGRQDDSPPDNRGSGLRRSDRSRWSYLFPAYDWFDLCQAAAAGHYDLARGDLGRMRGRMRRQGEQILARLAPTAAWHLTSEIGLGAAPGALPLRLHRRLGRERVMGVLVRNGFQTVERADLHVVEGMLLLELGRPGQAAAHFRRSLALYPLAAGTAPALPGRPLARGYLGRMRAFER